MKIRIVKRGMGIEPDSESDAILWGKIGEGDTIEASIRIPRNPDFHRYVWGLVDIIAYNWPGKVLTSEQAMIWLKYKTGHVKFVQNPETNEWVAFPDSISYDAMCQVDFADWWYNKALPSAAIALDISVETLESRLPKRPSRKLKMLLNKEKK